MGWDVTTGPGVTALGLAAARSVESGRPDRLIDDQFAEPLFRAAEADLPMLLDWPAEGMRVTDAQALHLHGSRYIGLRTRFFDDAVEAAVGRGVGQVVVLGAGLDTRAFRLELPPSLRLFELDQAGVLEFKDAVLTRQGAEPGCARSAVSVDLREGWASELLAAGFEPGRAALWVAEGLLPYLSPAGQRDLLGEISRLAAADSAIAADRIVGDPAGGGRARALSERSGIDMQDLLAAGAADDLAASLRDAGWEVEEQPASAIAERYGRDLSDPFAGGDPVSEPPWLDTVFLTAAYGSTRPRRIA